MNKKWLLGLLSSACILSAHAGTSPQNDTITPAWNQHHGPYIGSMIGFNLNRINFYSLTTQFHTVTQNLLLGYLVKPRWGFEGEIGSYFSGVGLAARGSVKGLLPIGTRANVFGDLGVSYISTFLDKGFVGPYIDVGLNYSLAKNVQWGITANDIISSYGLGALGNVSTNFASLLTGFTLFFD